MLDFGSSILVANNLGGQGPVLSDPPYLEYILAQDVLPFEICLRITNTSTYYPSFNPGGGVTFNGLSGDFGIINVLADSAVDLKFGFFDKATDMPVVLPFFEIIWFDFDEHISGGRVETLVAENTFEAYFTTDTTTVTVTQGVDSTSFSAGVPGGLADNPMDANNLTKEQEDKAVAFIYMDVSSFCVTLSIGGPANSNGRNLIFGASSQFVVNPPPPSPPLIPTPGIAVVKSDPHFQGLDGEVFDFDGEVGKVYALLVHAEDEMAVIARFGTAYTTGVSYQDSVLFPYKPKGTWISSVGVSVSFGGAQETVTLLVSSDRSAMPESEHTLQAGSMDLVGSSQSALELMEVTVTEEPTPVITFKTDVLEGKVFVVPPPSDWDVDRSDDAVLARLTHLNIGIDRLSVSDVGKLDGVIGVSALGFLEKMTHPEDAFAAANLVDEALIDQLP